MERPKFGIAANANMSATRDAKRYLKDGKANQ
jgi:hypothetical protein